MHLYRFQFTPLSPLKGQVDTNTLFGAICWGVRLLKGNSFLQERFLPAFTRGGEPPFLLSSPLPHGKSEGREVILFPRPLLPGSILDSEKGTISKRELIRSYPHHKRFKKITHLPWELFAKILKGEIKNERELFEEIAGEGGSSECVNWELPRPRSRTHSFPKASINRITSTTLGATLFNESATFRGPFSVLLLFSPRGEREYRQLVEEALKVVELGGNKTVGWGRVEVKSYRPQDDRLLSGEAYETITQRATQPNGRKTFMALSSFAALDENNRLVIEPHSSCYEHKVLRSAIDYSYAFYDERFIRTAVWKKAVLYITAGSTVKLSQQVEIKTGSLPLFGAVKRVYPDEEILRKTENAPRIYQYGLAFPLFADLNCNGGGEDAKASP